MKSRHLGQLLLMGALLAAALMPTARPAAAQELNVSEDFSGATAENWDLSGSAYLTASGTTPADSVGSGWLRLTDASGSQVGAALYNQPFSSSAGVKIEFTYATYGGSGADGFSFFLIDGSVISPTLGGFGGALGYAGPELGGISKGYLGIGFDEYGGWGMCATGGATLDICYDVTTPNVIGVRGSGDGTEGYELLSAVETTSLPGAPTIDGADRTESRDVRIVLSPDQILNVWVDFGSGEIQVVTDLDLGNAVGQVPLPPTFKMGFAASTGGLTNIHEVSNMTVLPSGIAPKVTVCPLMPDMEVRPQFINLEPGGTATVEVGVRNLCNDQPSRPFEVLTSFSDWLIPVSGSEGVVLREHSALMPQMELLPGETRFWSMTVRAPEQNPGGPVHITELYWSGRGADKRIDGVFIMSAPAAAPAEPVAAVPTAVEAAPAPAPVLPQTLPNTAGETDANVLLVLIAGMLLSAAFVLRRRLG